jgi:hypothetical protein
MAERKGCTRKFLVITEQGVCRRKMAKEVVGIVRRCQCWWVERYCARRRGAAFFYPCRHAL